MELERGTPAWAAACRRIKAAKKNPNQPFCGQAGGRTTRGVPCKSPWLMTNGLCKKHGGKALSGIHHPSFKHGRSTMMFKGMPERFRKAYLASITDDDLLSLRADIALSDARYVELVERLSTGESSERWERAQLTVDLLETELAQKEPDFDFIQGRCQVLRDLASVALEDDAVWDKLRTQADHRRKLADTERKRLKDLHAYLTAEEALAVVARLVDSVIRHVEDKEALSAILVEVQQLTGNDPAERRRAHMLEAV